MEDEGLIGLISMKISRLEDRKMDLQKEIDDLRKDFQEIKRAKQRPGCIIQ